MVEVIRKDAKEVWNKWSIRGLVIFSLTLQVMLVFFAPSRKRTMRKLLLALVWFAYLAADWSANYAVGQISDTQGTNGPSMNHELLAFWAPFLLLHLGGPDTITALALEDNELWPRHLYGLLCQAISTLYVLLLAIPTPLLAPTALMLVAGLIKFVERTRVLYLASSEKFRDSVQRKHAKLVGKYRTRKEIPAQIIAIEEPVMPNRELTHLEVVQYARKFFDIPKFLVTDLVFPSQIWDESKKLFGSLTPEDALRILEVELSFTSDALFTKAKILHTRIGGIFRAVALGCLLSSLCIFTMKNKDEYDRFDVGLTYALLIGGLLLHFLAVLMFCVSDWTFARMRRPKGNRDEEDTRADNFSTGSSVSGS